MKKASHTDEESLVQELYELTLGPKYMAWWRDYRKQQVEDKVQALFAKYPTMRKQVEGAFELVNGTYEETISEKLDSILTGNKAWDSLFIFLIISALLIENYTTGTHEKAYEKAFILLENHPDLFIDYPVTAHLIRGNMNHNRYEYEGALADYNWAIERAPDCALAYFLRANLKYIQTNRARRVGLISDYSQAIKLDPGYASAYYMRGKMKATRYDNKGAIADYNRTIELDSNNALAYFTRGNAKRKTDSIGAIADYSRATEIDPNYAVAYHNRGLIYEMQEKYADAYHDYCQATSIDPVYKTDIDRIRKHLDFL